MTKKADMQQLFDTAVEGILKQGKPAVTVTGVCRYRVGDSKCAIGHLIPDDMYVSEMEGQNAAGIIQSYCGENKQLPAKWKDYSRFLSELQQCHDLSFTDLELSIRFSKKEIKITELNKRFIRRFKTSTKKLAKKYDLDYRF